MWYYCGMIYNTIVLMIISGLLVALIRSAAQRLWSAACAIWDSLASATDIGVDNMTISLGQTRPWQLGLTVLLVMTALVAATTYAFAGGIIGLFSIVVLFFTLGAIAIVSDAAELWAWDQNGRDE